MTDLNCANGQSCTFGPHGPNGSIQCQYCGASPDLSEFFEDLFDDAEPRALPAGTTIDGKRISLPFRPVAEELFQKMVAAIKPQPAPLVRYVPLINMGGDYCGFGLASEYPEDDESEGEVRYSNDGEWYRADDVDALFAKLMKHDTPAPSDGLSEAVTKFLKAYDDLGSRGYTRNVAHRIANLRAAIAQKDEGK